MKRAAALALGVALAHGAALAEWRAPPLIAREGEALYYRGFVNGNGASRIVPLIRSGFFRRLRIDSAGGDVAAGMAIGTALFEQKMDVAVSGKCLSSCANYIFPAGREKHIEPASWVLWHGDVRQWNFVEDQLAVDAKAAAHGVQSLDAKERWVFEHGGRLMRQQDDFYRRIGVVDGFARYGQELEPRVWRWTFPLQTMALFGIRNVNAPADYGSPAYCRRAQESSREPLGIACLDIGPETFQAWRERQPR